MNRSEARNKPNKFYIHQKVGGGTAEGRLHRFIQTRKGVTQRESYGSELTVNILLGYTEGVLW